MGDSHIMGGLKKDREAAPVNKSLKKGRGRKPLIDVTVSLVVEILAHVDSNQMGLLVQEAGQQAGRAVEESKKWCPHGGSQAVP